MSSAFGASRSKSRPPEKGVFPLDHFNECKAIAKAYLECLDEHDQQASKCEDLSRAYLECRMSKELMAKQDLADLGLLPVRPAAEAEAAEAEAKERAQARSR
ncbi:hypothetical protein HYH03_017402 [Edaphochlamys debaryana]|uniref:Cytochrome c oxidase assembly protein COX19 n=1 Tax=Edaphochlamys debaryana TaxID=47281 RepID=A0A836BPB4_9CHLO|nr:hypothetical protein HYH03_017402 [Edaphochlamys debaryana]|eukprot:KAG2483747.1 hypothetical protein HYH03_017402 [Edaphochlamys debaryana]